MRQTDKHELFFIISYPLQPIFLTKLFILLSEWLYAYTWYTFDLLVETIGSTNVWAISETNYDTPRNNVKILEYM